MSVTMRDGLVLRDDLERRTETNLADAEHTAVEPGDLAYNTMRMWQGAFGIATEAANVSPAYVVMRPTADMDPRFAWHWLKSDRALYRLWAYSYGLTDDRLRLYAADFGMVPLVPPPLREQRRIAAVLDAWDESIALNERLVAAKRQYAEAAIRRLSVKWKTRSVDTFGRVVGGGTPSMSRLEFWNGGTIPWVSSKDMGPALIRKTEDQITTEAVASSATQEVPTGSVLIVTRSGILRHSVPIGCASQPMAINQDIKAVLCDNYETGRLLTLILRGMQQQILFETGKVGTTVESLDFNALKAFPVPFPQAEDVVGVDKALSTLTNEIDLLAARTDLLRIQKRGLMQRLLTGAVRVPETIDALMPGSAPREAAE